MNKNRQEREPLSRVGSSRTTSLEPPYVRYAFLNPYNLSLVVGLVLVALLTGHDWLIVVVAALEALWLIFAPDSRLLRAVWFDPAFARAERAYAEERCKKKVALLPSGDHARLVQLATQQEEIERLARDNPSLAVDLLLDELGKLDGLLVEFVDLGIAAARADQHALSFDFAAMRRSWQAYGEQVERHPALDPRRQVAEKNLAVLRQRRARYDDLSRTIQVARGQMDLIEHTFRLLGDEILTIGSPRELGGRIDELRLAVEAVREASPDAWIEEDALEVERSGKEMGAVE